MKQKHSLIAVEMTEQGDVIVTSDDNGSSDVAPENSMLRMVLLMILFSPVEWAGGNHLGNDP